MRQFIGLECVCGSARKASSIADICFTRLYYDNCIFLEISIHFCYNHANNETSESKYYLRFSNDSYIINNDDDIIEIVFDILARLKFMDICKLL